MRAFRVFGSGILGVLVLAGSLPAQQSPALADLLARAAAYVASYAERVSGAVLEEEYLLMELGPRMQVPKRIGSDVVFLSLNGLVIALRDVYAIDTTPLRERTPRIPELLARPTPEKWQLAQEYARQGHFHFLTEIVIRGSEPTLALQFIAEANQTAITYRLDGRKALNGVQLLGVRFEETKRRDGVYLLDTRGNAAASGRFWIDPADGTIQQTELWLESSTEVARMSVTYAAHPALKLWLPKETTETYESRQIGVGASASGSAHNLVHRVEGKARYSNARYSPIDLTKGGL